MHEFLFESCGCVARVRSYAPHLDSVVEQLAADFKAFQAPLAGAAPVVDVIFADQIPSEKGYGRPLRRLFHSMRIEVFGWGNHRICDFAQGRVKAESKFIKGTRCFWVAGQDLVLAREAAYTILLSAIGEELDRRGTHRVHALGAEMSGRRILLLAPSGGGKSSIASLLLRHSPGAKLYSDESPLLRGPEIFPFPIRLAMNEGVARALDLESEEGARFRAKVLFPFPREREARPGKVDLLLIGRRVRAGGPSILPRRRLTVVPALFMGLVVGIGLAQMAEWMLRLNSLPSLFRIALSRLATMSRLLRHASGVYVFNLSADARKNTECLEKFVTEGVRAPRMRNRLLMKMVLAADRMTRGPRFYPFHEGLRRFYRGPFSRGLQFYLRRRHAEAHFRLVPRHSVARVGAFSAFRSDIDYSLVIGDDRSMAVVARSYEKLRRRLPILGELEVYTDLEFQLQSELAKDHGPLLRWIRLLRKWTREPMDMATSYHHEKDDLARLEILAELCGHARGASELVPGGNFHDLSRALESFVGRLHPRLAEAGRSVERVAWQSPFLGWQVTDQAQTSAAPRLHLKTPQLGVFLALLPDLDNPPEELKEALADLRDDPELAKGYSAVLASELITCWSVRRVPSRNSPEMEDWVGRLEKQLQRYNPELYRKIETIKAVQARQSRRRECPMDSARE